MQNLNPDDIVVSKECCPVRSELLSALGHNNIRGSHPTIFSFELPPCRYSPIRLETFSEHESDSPKDEILWRNVFGLQSNDESRIEKVLNWGPCRNVSEVRAFLGTVGVCQMFIRNFAHRASPLTMLTRKNHPFIFGPEQIDAQDDLKQAVINSPALRPLDHSSESPVILAVGTSPIAISFHLCQCDEVDPRKWYYARFGSIMLKDRESRFFQPKLELYGLYRSLCLLKLYLISI